MSIRVTSRGFNKNKINEGKVMTLDKDATKDQKVIEVGCEMDKKNKVSKEDKQSYNDFVYVYKTKIDDKCIELYGDKDDKELWDDVAKEMFLKTKNYIPTEETKSSGELNVKKENKNVKPYSRLIKEYSKQG